VLLIFHPRLPHRVRAHRWGECLQHDGPETGGGPGAAPPHTPPDRRRLPFFFIFNFIFSTRAFLLRYAAVTILTVSVPLNTLARLSPDLFVADQSCREDRSVVSLTCDPLLKQLLDARNRHLLGTADRTRYIV